MVRSRSNMKGRLQRYFFVIVAVNFFVLSGCSAFQNIREPESIEASSTTITVMSFNIRHGCGLFFAGTTSGAFFRNCPKHLDAVAAAIRSVDPDIVGLQEVRTSQAGDLGEMLNMNYAYLPHNSGGYGSSWANNY